MNIAKIAANCLKSNSFQARHKLPESAVCLLLQGDHVVFTKRSEGLRIHPGEIAFPGGIRKAGDMERLQDCARRECLEEIGISPGDMFPMGCWHNRKSDIAVHSFLGQLSENLTMRINPSEVDSIIWVPLRYLCDYPSTMQLKKIYSGWPLVPHFYIRGVGVIWGVSGFILKAFLDEYKRALT